MASDIDEIRREFDETRRELDEMSAEIALAEQRMTQLTRQDLQVGDLRDLLADAKARHARLKERAAALHADFFGPDGDRPDRTH